MDEGRYLVDELCRRTGFSRRTVRYYVQEGLVDPPAGRGRGGFYGEHHVAQLARIRGLQDQGYRLDAIRGLLGREAPIPIAAPAPVVPAPAAPAQAAADREVGAGADRSPVAATSWTRHEVAPGIEVHVSAEAGTKLGPAIEAALDAVRSIIEREGGTNG
jgi:DNA-binding transcriptional MerR regulator